MARVTRIEFIDDFDGMSIADGEGEEVKFALDGTDYAIDLRVANAAALREALAPFVAKATKVSSVKGRRRSGGSSKSSSEINAIREWARTNGHEVGDRGRIRAEIIEAYRRTVS